MDEKKPHEGRDFEPPLFVDWIEKCKFAVDNKKGRFMIQVCHMSPRKKSVISMTF